MFTALALSLALIQTPPTVSDLTLTAEPGVLAGTMIDAGPGVPAAVIIAGSGPTDRDGNSPLGVQASYLRQLAEGLAAEGITTVRYDKRGIAGSASAAIAEADLRFDHLVADAREWADQLREETGQSCVWLIGHSEGALIAQSAAVGDEGVCGLVLISGAGRPAAVVLREQLAQVPEPLQGQALVAVADLEAGRTTDCPAMLASVCRASVQPYLMSWLPIDPAALAAVETLPTLVIQGLTDLQTSETDARTLAAANETIDLVLLEGVNHVLKDAPMERMANLAAYADPDLPLNERIVPTVAGFILQTRGD